MSGFSFSKFDLINKLLNVAISHVKQDEPYRVSTPFYSEDLELLSKQLSAKDYSDLISNIGSIAGLILKVSEAANKDEDPSKLYKY